MLKEEIIHLTINEICQLKANIILNDQPDIEHWTTPQCAFYVLSLLLGCVKPQEIIPLTVFGFTDCSFDSLLSHSFETTKLGKEGLIALYKYLGEGEYENQQYDLLQARNWLDGNTLIEEIHNRNIDEEKGRILHFPLYKDGLQIPNLFKDLTDENKQLIKNTPVPIRLRHS